MTDRKPVFDAIRKWRGGKGFAAGEVDAIDALLDTLEPEPSAVPVGDPFEAALTEILKHEGGFVNHPRDPGGMTNLGVTKRTWEDWTGSPTTEAAMRSLTRTAVAPLYRKNYWDAIHGDEMPGALALCVFDFAVNAGPGRSARYLQKLVGAVQDGQIGPATIAAVNDAARTQTPAELVRRFQQSRRDYYRQLGTFKTFGKGWLRRVDDVESAALRLA